MAYFSLGVVWAPSVVKSTLGKVGNWYQRTNLASMSLSVIWFRLFFSTSRAQIHSIKQANETLAISRSSIRYREQIICPFAPLRNNCNRIQTLHFLITPTEPHPHHSWFPYPKIYPSAPHLPVLDPLPHMVTLLPENNERACRNMIRVINNELCWMEFQPLKKDDKGSLLRAILRHATSTSCVTWLIYK